MSLLLSPELVAAIVAAAEENAVALVKVVVDAVQGPSKVRAILDAEYTTIDVAADVLEEQKLEAIAKAAGGEPT